MSMVNLESIRRRHGRYEWEERHRDAQYLSIWLLIFGAILIIAGVVLSILMLSGRIALPYSSGIRIVIAIVVLLLGLLLGSALLAVSRMLRMVRDVEQNTRYAMNIWFILEEKDLAEEGGEGEVEQEYSAGVEEVSSE
ncbi:MAG: hypothetical protein LUO93_05845 [Methanomicrobiales archaeon]|nr:hypothetical protein [Methanomicrobiales archaeon]